MPKQAVFNRLYSNGQKELKKREKVYNASKNVISSECTFSPTLSPVRGQQKELTIEDFEIKELKRTKIKLNVKDCLNAIVGAVEEISGKINSNNQSMKKRNGKLPSTRQYVDKYKLKLKEIYKRKQADIDDQIKVLEKQKRKATAKKNGGENSRFNRLYKDAAERRLRIDKAHIEKKKELPQEYTFKPIIYTKTKRNRNKEKYNLPGKDKSISANITTNNKKPETADERFARVIKRNEDYMARRKKFLNDSLRQKPNGCTFMPEVNKNYNKSGGQKKLPDAKAACLTLYYRGEKERKARNEQIKKEKIERDIRRRLQTTSIWGSPVISMEEALENIKKNPNGDIETNLKPSPPKNVNKAKASGGRAAKVTMARNASKNASLNLNGDDDIQCTFKPRINKKKKRQASNKPIYDRLYKDGKEHLKRSLTREKANPTGCTFKPTIRGTSSSSSKNNNDKDRFLSLYKDGEARLQRRDEAYSQLPNQCTFRPDISASNDNGMGENADR